MSNDGRKRRSGIEKVVAGDGCNNILLLTMSLKVQAVPAGEAFYKRTIARVAKIQSHLAETPRGNKLKDKVCIITGVDSLKGIGYVDFQLFQGYI